MRLPRLAVENRQFTFLVIGLLVVLGVTALMRMPKSEDPPVAKPGATIMVVFPGGSPEDLEELVVDPVEEVINQLDDIKKIQSSSVDGLAMIFAEFTPGSDPDEKYDKINEAINRVRPRLPDGINRMETIQWTVSDTAFMQLALCSEQAEFLEFHRLLDRIDKRLKRIPGIKGVEAWGLPDFEVRVDLDLVKLAQLQIPVNQVLGIVNLAGQNIPGGDLQAGGRRLVVRTSGTFTSLSQLADTVIQSDGILVTRLGDVAQIRLGHEPPPYVSRVDGRRSVYFSLKQKENTNLFSIMNQLAPALDEVRLSLPEGMTLETVYSQVESVNKRLNLFYGNLLEGILLVGLVMLIFIGWRGASVVMLVVPFSLIIGLGFVDLSGFGIQQMTITGLVITLGMLVDNAIVVVENTTRFRREGMSPLDASIRGTSQIGWAIISATATTLLAFWPLATMRDVAGDFIRSMPVTVIYTLSASLLLALTMSPLFNLYLLPHDGRLKETRTGAQTAAFIKGPYRRLLGRALERPKTVVAVSLMVLILSLGLFPVIGVAFFPKAEKKQFFVNVATPEGSALWRTEEAVSTVERMLLDDKRVTRVAASVGQSNPRIYYNMIETRRDPTRGQLFVRLDEAVSWKEMASFIDEYRKRFARVAGADVEIKELEQAPPVGAPVEIHLLGERTDVLRNLADQVESRFREVKGLINIDNPARDQKGDLRVDINRDKAAMLGIPLADIDRQVRLALAGFPVSRLRLAGGDSFPVVMRASFVDQPTLETLRGLFFRAQNGAMVPLAELADIRLESGPAKLHHYNLQRSTALRADVERGYSTVEVTDRVLEKLSNMALPPGCSYVVAGEKEGQEESFGGLGQAAMLAILAIFAVLVLQFRSLRQPLIIFSSLPLAIIGALVALFLSGNPFSFTAFIGTCSLVGIVVNNAILLVDSTNQLIREEGLPIRQALQRIGEIRFLPILLTTLTTVIGLVPLALQGGDLWAPLCWVIIGGLLTSTALTLVVVPVLYLLYEGRQSDEGER